jgi:hypothetical protein
MVAGFNTEIDCGSTRYHIQTEVMPRQDAAILTLVYQAGAIIDRVKRSYLDILGDSPTQEEVRFLAERQHWRMIAAIQERHGVPGGRPAEQEPATPAAPPANDPTLDQLILEYLTSKEHSDPRGTNRPEG